MIFLCFRPLMIVIFVKMSFFTGSKFDRDRLYYKI